MQELNNNSDRLLQRYNQHKEEMAAKLVVVTTSCKILKTKFQKDATRAKDELDTFQAKYEMGETQHKSKL